MYSIIVSLIPVIFVELVLAIPYSEYILAPSTRSLQPASIHRINGTVINASSLLSTSTSDVVTGNATLFPNSTITFDFLKNIAGIVSIDVANSTSPGARIGITYTESSLWINGLASDATADAGLDEVLWLPVGNGPGTYTIDRDHERGAFRYLSLIYQGTSSIVMEKVAIEFTAAPDQEDLTDYTGWFHSDDELLNRIWYAGAYTNQLCTIDPQHGDALIHTNTITSNMTISLPETNTWWSNTTITNGTSALVDGAKRDRLVWPGDMAISLPSIFVSTNDMVSIKNSLDSLLALQNGTTGMLPYAGYPFNERGGVSFTYHLYTLIGVVNYYLYSGDEAYLRMNWDGFVKGLNWSLGFVDETGLMNVTSPLDWGRSGMIGHNIEANAILYHTLTQGIDLATILNDTTSISTWTPIASKLKAAANTLLWNPTTNLYTDNETTTFSPQDGNSWAVKANLTLSLKQNSLISNGLKSRWGEYGAPAPEAGSNPATISPFIGSFELESHFLSQSPVSALQLIRKQWGFMLNNPLMTNSTFIEGYSADGSLIYPAYTNDARVSHAHGWSTGPTSLLSFYVAGIRLISAGGREWRIEPLMGDLRVVSAGFETGLGVFSSEVEAEDGSVTGLRFSTPEGTMGNVVLEGVEGSLRSGDGEVVKVVSGVADGLKGGSWTLLPS